MLKLKSLVARILLAFTPRLVPIPGNTINGAVVDYASMVNALNAIAQNAASAAGNVNYSTTAATTLTLTALSAYSVFLSAGSAVTVTVDSAYNIGLRLPQPLAVGQQFTFELATAASTTVATPTLTDTAVTLAGTTSISASSKRNYVGALTQVYSTTGISYTAGTTFTSLTQVGSTNAYTVALSGNSVSPTVGQLIYLSVSTGTLPSGWYPIIKVTSATSFVISAPVTASAWTATAATLGVSGATASATYSPLITITGMYSASGYAA